MAVVTRSMVRPGAKPSLLRTGKAAKPLIQPLTVDLPTEPSIASHNPSDYHFLIHGEKKIGKTTFATVEPKVFLMTYDPIQKALEILQRHIPDWKTFMAYLLQLETAVKSGKYPYKRVVVDGADMWYRSCQTWCEKELSVEHISEEKWGKGWDMLKQNFGNAVDRLLALPGGCWFVSHSKWAEIETRQSDRKIEKLLPLLKAGGEEILVGKVDGWFAYDYVGKERVLVIRGDERTGAGNRVRGHFLTPAGEPVSEIPMGDSEQEAWNNFLLAFNNGQKFPSLAARDIIPRKEAPKPTGSKNGRTVAAPVKRQSFFKR